MLTSPTLFECEEPEISSKKKRDKEERAGIRTRRRGGVSGSSGETHPSSNSKGRKIESERRGRKKC